MEARVISYASVCAHFAHALLRPALADHDCDCRGRSDGFDRLSHGLIEYKGEVQTWVLGSVRLGKLRRACLMDLDGIYLV